MTANHQFSVDDELWEWARANAGGTGKSPSHWLRQFLHKCMTSGLITDAEIRAAVDASRTRPSGYVGDVRVLKLRRDNESRCNRCGVFLTSRDLVIEQHFITANGGKVTHYLHGWGCTPAAPK